VNLLAAFLLGLAGSLHCAAMCGPLILAVTAARRRSAPGAAPGSGQRDLLHPLAYHGGRLLTYAVLGAISGLIGAAVIFAGFQRWLSLAAGGLIVIGAFTTFRGKWTGLPAKFVLAAKTKFGALLQNRALGASALLGGLNGLLPCGLVYVACAAAATAGGVAGGMATMLAFGLGTAPMLLGLGFAGRAIRWANPLHWRRLVLAGTTTVGLLLIVRGLDLGIPYLSPAYTGGYTPVCVCHRTL